MEKNHKVSKKINKIQKNLDMYMNYRYYKRGMQFENNTPAQRYNGEKMFLSIIDENNDETDLVMWNPINKEHARFLKITTHNHNELYIHKDWHKYVEFGLKWEDTEDLRTCKLLTSEKEEDDTDGFNNCVKILQKIKQLGLSINQFPAIKHACQFHEHYGIGPWDGNYQSYLPSIGELIYIYQNANTLNNILNAMGSWPLTTTLWTFHNFDGQRFMATSSESDAIGIWQMFNVEGTHKYSTDSFIKNEHMFMVFPLFKCLDDL